MEQQTYLPYRHTINSLDLIPKYHMALFLEPFGNIALLIGYISS